MIISSIIIIGSIGILYGKHNFKFITFYKHFYLTVLQSPLFYYYFAELSEFAQSLINVLLTFPYFGIQKSVVIKVKLLVFLSMQEDKAKQNLFTSNYDGSENKMALTRIKQEPVNSEDLVPGFAVDQSLLLPVLSGMDDSVLTSDVKQENKPRQRKRKSQEKRTNGKRSKQPKEKRSQMSKEKVLKKKDKKGMFVIYEYT